MMHSYIQVCMYVWHSCMYDTHVCMSASSLRRTFILTDLFWHMVTHSELGYILIYSDSLGHKYIMSEYECIFSSSDITYLCPSESLYIRMYPNSEWVTICQNISPWVGHRYTMSKEEKRRCWGIFCQVVAHTLSHTRTKK